MSATSTAGYVTRQETCQKHNRIYAQLFLERLNHWAGQCDQCAKEEKLENEARAIIEKKFEEKQRRIIAKLSEHSEKQIADRVRDAKKKHLEEYKAWMETLDWEGPINQEIHARAEEVVEREMIAEIIEQLKKENQ